jgi:hypothetical protein
MNVANGDGAQALDVNVLASLFEGSAVVSGCEVGPGDNALEVDVTSGTVIVEQSRHSVSAQTVSLSSANSDPRKDLVYVDGSGSVAVAEGIAEPAAPSNATGRDTYRPSPPDLNNTAATPVAEVWIGANASDIATEDVTDRRPSGTLPNALVDALGNFGEDEQLSSYPLANADVSALSNFGSGATFSDYPLAAGGDTDSAVDVGYVVADSSNSTPYTLSVTTGFAPRYVEFYANLHQASVGSTYYSGGNSGGGSNAIAFSEGYATGSASGDQTVSGVGDNSDSTNAHRTYVGTGEVVHLMQTSSAGETLDGRVRTNISSFDSDGFTLEWTANYANAPVLYRAFR